MREIKFRAWDKVEKRFWYFTLQEILERRMSYRGSWDEKVLIGEKTQYTGLKDKDGRMIYEGDVYGYTLTIDGSHWNEHQIQIADVVKFEDGAFYHGEHLLSDVIEYDNTLTYLGNKYENPELLEESQNGTK